MNIRTTKQLRESGLDEVIVRLANQERKARTLLQKIGYPTEKIPAFRQASDYWPDMFEELEFGVIEDGIARLLDALEQMYPANAALRARHTATEAQSAQPQKRSRAGFSVVINGREGDPLQFVIQARELAEQANMPPPVELAVATEGTIILYVENATEDQAYALAQAIYQAEPELPLIRVTPGRDALYERLNVTAPDGSQFTLRDVPFSTPSATIGAVTVGQFDSEFWDQDRDGLARETTVDFRTGDDQDRRLRPEESLEEAGVSDNAELDVNTEARAASVNANIREAALARARAQILRFAKQQANFEVEANARIAPTQYQLRFRAPGFAPPPSAHSEPIPVDSHIVRLNLPAGFPMQAPQALWVSPIFHPNIHPLNHFVCLGALGDAYLPGLDFAELCKTLIAMASYQNYDPRDNFNPNACQWAISEVGQAAIIARGGRSIATSIGQKQFIEVAKQGFNFGITVERVDHKIIPVVHDAS